MVAIFLAGFVVFHFIGRYFVPMLAYTRHEQPVDFSHVFHGNDVDMSCETCHFFYEDGSWSGIPTLDVCMNCHSEQLGESEAEKVFVTEYVQKNREVQWELYFRQPQCVSFSHSSHVKEAKLACETCHGPQGLSRHPTKYIVNRITKYSYVVYDSASSTIGSALVRSPEENVWGTMGMDECAKCHRARGVSTACFICHK